MSPMVRPSFRSGSTTIRYCFLWSNRPGFNSHTIFSAMESNDLCGTLLCQGVKVSRTRGLEDSRNRRRVQQQRDRIERLVELTNATADKSSSSAIESNDLSRSQGVEDLRNRTTCRANKCHRRRVQQQRDRIKRLAERLVETTGPVALLRLGRLGLGRLVAASSKRRTTVHLQNAPKVSFRNEPKEDLE